MIASSKILTIFVLLIQLIAACGGSGAKKSNDTPVDTAEGIAPVSGAQPDSDVIGGGASVIPVMPTDTKNTPLVIVPSTALSQVTVATAEVNAGDETEIKLKMISELGNPMTSGGSLVEFYLGGTGEGLSNGSISEVTDHGDGTYTAIFKGFASGSSRAVNASISGKPVTSSLPSLKVNPGTAVATKSQIQVSQTSLSSGVSESVTLITRDEYENRLNTGGLSVEFFISGGSSTGTFGPVQDLGDGTYSAIFTGAGAGTAVSVDARISGVPVGLDLPTITVVPGSGSLAQSSVTLSASSVNAGNSVNVTLTVRDQSSNQVPSGGALVAFSHAGGVSTGTFSPVVDNGDGTHSSTFSGVFSGSPTTIQATLDGLNVTSALPEITVAPGSISMSTSSVTVSSNLVAAGSSTNISMTTRDSFGNLISTGGRTVQLQLGSGTSSGSISSVTDLGNGTYTATFTAATSGSPVSINAQVDGENVTSTSPSITVVPGAVSLANSTVSLSQATVASGSNATVTLTAKDANNNVLTTGGLTVAFAIGGGAGTFGSVTDLGNGNYSGSFTAGIVGTRELSATVGSSAVTSAMPSVTVTPGAFSLSQSIVSVSSASQVSGLDQTVTLSVKDAAGNQLSTGGLTVVFLTSGSGTSTGSFSATTDAGSGIYSATFTGVLKGTAKQIAAQINGSTISSTLPTITVTPGAISTETSTISASPSSVASGSSATLTLTARDAAGNLLTTGGSTVTFDASGGTSTGAIGTVIDNNNGTYSAPFTGVDAGTATAISAQIESAPVSTTSPSVTVVPGPFDENMSYVTVSQPTVIAGEQITFTLQAVDEAGNQLNTGGGTVVFSLSNGSSTGTVGTAVYAGNGRYTATFTGALAGTSVDVLATFNTTTLNSAPPSIMVLTGPASSATSTVTVSNAIVEAGSSVVITLTTYDIAGNPVTTGGAAVTFSLTGGTSNGSFGSTTDVGDGTYTAIFTGATAGSATTIRGEIAAVELTTTLPQITVTPSATIRYVLSGFPTSINAGTAQNFDLDVQDNFGNPITNYVGTVQFTSNDGAAILPEDYVFVVGDAGRKTFSVTLRTLGTRSISAREFGNPSVTGIISGISVTPGAPAKIAFSGITASYANYCSSAITVATADLLGNPSPFENDITVALGGNGSGVFYSDSACLSAIMATSISAGSSSTTIYFRDATAESLTLTATDQSAILAPGSQGFTVYPYQAWIGASGTPQYFASGGGIMRGRLDAQFATPIATALDSNNFFYTVDSGNHRIMKYDNADGSFIGWIGNVYLTPSGGANGCSSTASSTFTPGWCRGGFSRPGNGNGMLSSPVGIHTAGGFLYVADQSNNRISRYNAATGSFQGWIGKVATVPTGGDPGCTTAAVNSFTPGWCIGGTAGSGTGDGMLSAPKGIIGIGNFLYVSDGNHRIMRYTLAGAFAGWIGRVSTVPTGGASGCTSTAAGNAVPGWCFGGTARSGTGNGMFNSPRGLSSDGTTVFVADTSNNRVSKFVASSGVYGGWIGNVNTTATGGTAGCNTTPVSTGTPGWCFGGTAKSGSGNAMYSSPYWVHVEGSDLIVADFGNSRMVKVAAANGAFVGWVGRIATTAGLGGASGCSTSQINTVTPGWCTGGTAATGVGEGMMNAPQAVYGASGSIYLSDSSNNRIVKYDVNTGLAQGWTGSRTKKTSAWSVAEESYALTGVDDGSFSNASGTLVVGSNLYVVDTGNHRIKRYSLASGAFSGWIGNIWTPPTGGDPGCAGAAINVATPGWCTGGDARSGTGNGQLNSPQSIYSDGTNLFVTDSGNFRIVRYTLSTGVFTGWIGNINSVATGGASGCSTAAVNTFTPGWCLGGTARTGTGNGMLNAPVGIDGDGTNLYVADGGNFRISRYTMSSGAFSGWIGNVNTVPTGGASGCTSTAVGTVTPGWCLGGTARTGTGTGMMNAPKGVMVSGTDLYVVDTNNHRINRYTLSTGTATGWIGRISSATGLSGATGCSTASAGSFTPGWCTGGTAQSGSGNGMLNTPRGAFINGTSLYVSDTANHRISKYTLSSGAFVGWSGSISSTVGLGGAAGCSTSLSGALTPGWCTGGTSKAGALNGMFDVPAYLSGDSTYIYVTDQNHNRVVRIPK